MKIVFSRSVIKDIRKLDHKVQRRIKKKLLWFAEQKKPINFAEALTESEMGQYRFRIGDYRVLFDIGDNQIIRVHAIGHRSNVYK